MAILVPRNGPSSAPTIRCRERGAKGAGATALTAHEILRRRRRTPRAPGHALRENFPVDFSPCLPTMMRGTLCRSGGTVDAHCSGAWGGKPVGVRVPPSAPFLPVILRPGGVLTPPQRLLNPGELSIASSCRNQGPSARAQSWHAACIITPPEGDADYGFRLSRGNVRHKPLFCARFCSRLCGRTGRFLGTQGGGGCGPSLHGSCLH